MYKNKYTFLLAWLMLFAINAQAQSVSGSDELLTLFTTPQERALIDRNRYRKTPQKVSAETRPVEPEEQQVVLQTVTINPLLNGVSFSQSGQHVAWLDGQAYENGAKLADGSKVVIRAGQSLQVQIKTPDGRFHPLTTGEQSEIKYQKPIGG